MSLTKDIPESFWSLFRSQNRSVYMEALLQINKEYEYNNYFISKEVCIQIISSYVAERNIVIKAEEQESEIEQLEPMATRILNWLMKAQWLKPLEDYVEGVTNIIIPDYASVFLEAFERLEVEDDTDIYIQNIYGNLFSYMNDGRANDSMLKTAMVNTRKLNKVLQTMLHNMDKFFTSLLEKDSYEELLKEHLDGYVQEIVDKKYHIIKTSDNFYQYKGHIQYWLGEISRQKEEQLELLMLQENNNTKEVEGRRRKLLEVLDNIESMQRGFDAIEHRIANMDKEHAKYVRTTVMRLNYLLNEDSNMKGMVIQLLQHLSKEETEESMKKVASCMRFTKQTIVSSNLLYKPREPKKEFKTELIQTEEIQELSKEDILKLNKIKKRYSKAEIESFIESCMKNGKAVMTEDTIQTEEAFEKLILAYDLSIQKNSKFTVIDTKVTVENERYCYPQLEFIYK